MSIFAIRRKSVCDEAIYILHLKFHFPEFVAQPADKDLSGDDAVVSGA